jgi:2-polyprenyl-3-methyl-5-hydroxy-6-metoxy-1,4-benzoquinol methylase
LCYKKGIFVRRKNFLRIIRLIDQFTQGGERTLLDVGCAHGLFLEMTAKVQGVEPHHAVAQSTRSKGFVVRKGYFPSALANSERFDVIVFNDVLEHIPNIQKCLAACHRMLNHDGILVLNLPNSRGILYWLSKILRGFGPAPPTVMSQ